MIFIIIIHLNYKCIIRYVKVNNFLKKLHSHSNYLVGTLIQCI